MVNRNIFPNIVNVTDLRYRWPKIAKELKKGGWPVLVVEHSTPKAVIFSFEEAEKLWRRESKVSSKKDPLFSWRKRYASQFSNFDATKVIRKFRDTRWNLS